ncbi:calA, partial [Symbiodinium sp. KB8]
DPSRDVVTFNAGISACEIQAKWPTALSIFRDACDGVKLHLVTFGAMLTTARRAAAWEVTLAALRQMRPRSLYPNEVCGNAAIAALRTQSAKWADARSLLMVELGASSTSLVLSSLVRPWREVLKLLSQWGDGSLLTVPTLNAGITACHRGSRWEMSLWILSKMMCSSGARPDAITCASALAGCERGQRWQLVAQLLGAFHRLSTQLDLTVSQAALSAAAKGHAWRSATQGIREVTQQGFGLSVAAINSAAFACQSGKRWRWSAELTGQLRFCSTNMDQQHTMEKRELGRGLGKLGALPDLENSGQNFVRANMGSGASVASGVQDATPAQLKETFGALSAEEQKKITEALAKVETKAETAAAPATGETPSTEAKPEEKKAEEPEMTDEQLSMLKAAFDDIDTNGSKYIEAAELKTVLGKMKVELSDDQIDAVFKRADLNKDGKLSFDEYKKLVSAGIQAKEPK